MNKLGFNLENCYGIKKLVGSFDFSESHMKSIYASNGIMKTSFSRAFKDLSEGTDSKDLIFPERETIREIMDENGNPIDRSQVFVIEPYSDEFDVRRISTLLVNRELKNQYDDIHFQLDNKKEDLIKRLKSHSGLKKGIEEEILKIGADPTISIYDCLNDLHDDITNEITSDFVDIEYSIIFNDKVLDFLNDSDVRLKLNEYIEKYNDLIDSSIYFKKGVFTHTNAENISKNLGKDGFFEADHHLLLNGNDEEIESKVVESQSVFDTIIVEEIEKILDNPELNEKFKSIDKKITKNMNLTAFRSYLENHQSIIPELMDLDSLRSKIWISYLQKEKDLYLELLHQYLSSKKDLSDIITNAKKEVDDWKNVIDIFNKRFSVPFKLKIQNQEDIILKNTVPTITFVFEESTDSKEVQTLPKLLDVLSNGEKKALYILNIIFELESRKRNTLDNIFIFDDIADSFDYKNKYAIIEYLKEMTSINNFYSIILTHNFDFFRTIESRFLHRTHCYMTVKDENKVELIEAKYFNPFKHFRNKCHNDDMIKIATVPFMRNIIEYTMGMSNPDYKSLTSILHIQKDISPVTISDLDIIIKKIFNKTFDTTNGSVKVSDKIYDLANTCLSCNEAVNLENKIVLSIATRLKAEEFMIAKINDDDKITSISKNQTLELFKLYTEMFPDKKDNIDILGQVNLMTPENIHLNSFMYEPILDISDAHLRDLYTDVMNNLA